MKRVLAFLAASLCVVMASAMAAPIQPGQQGAAVARNTRAAVQMSGRKLLHRHHDNNDYSYDWQLYSSYDDEVYRAAKFIIKVLSRDADLLRTLFGDSYQEGYTPEYINIPKAYYYVDSEYNKFYFLSLYIEYYGEYYTIDFIVFAPHHEHHYYPEYLYEISYNNNNLKGSWSA